MNWFQWAAAATCVLMMGTAFVSNAIDLVRERNAENRFYHVLAMLVALFILYGLAGVFGLTH